ncbi:ribose-phosphate pyrophosphokinase [Methylobacterium sp. Leaf399]|uniref:phosphonate metabolism protein/1,5-bisphosphokinase (PRPP-forming) PhnN n=1 Tax=unclassified Methylobacterium TaxID=2615210 RepID=UPI0007003F51|nr:MULTISPECIES: phosphonate metabolism protein/1,5-bisphosphokinase (PRPP-forming) PhnN [unclassified Methylobacterium]KQP59732.1 ribose-phosphate pyrophosphokinase [Methylobacterium sp. Leaf108]KQT19839.1 ribose-phosphate pyrophosphokinase [Methylobacterium sp. Leaf399]
MAGGFVLVVGPSGAGKDTLLRLARDRLAGDPRFVFPRRLVTRPPSAHEANLELDDVAFDMGVQAHAFALHWRAHGLGYAIPAETVRQADDGHWIVCNVSRRIVSQARRTLPRVSVVQVTASPEVLARRLATRGRPEDGDLRARLDRAIPIEAECTIHNDADAEGAADRLVVHLRACVAGARPGAHTNCV